MKNFSRFVALGSGLIALQLPIAWCADSSLASDSKEKKNERYENLELFQRVLQYIETNYVDETKNKDLMYGAIKGMLETLDPHSNFLPPEIFRDMKMDTSGKFGGIGIELGMKDNILTVVAPIEDTPAWKAGIKPGDRIVKINGESTKGMTLVEAVAKMRGSKGSDVKLAIYREGFEKVRNIKMSREMVKIQSVKSAELEPGFAFVRLTSFNENAASDVKKAIDKLQSHHPLRGLVFDLRTNPGGLLDQAVEVSSLFVDDGVIVSTIGRNRDEKNVKWAMKGKAYKDLPVAILVNSSTASAAEIVAGALQDHHRAIIMGQQTFGKGSVQTVVDLGNELGLKLTIARYYTPSGRSIQEKGVTPDIMLEDYDPKILAEARRKSDYTREKDLKRHMVNTDKPDQEAKQDESGQHDDYSMDELEMIGKREEPKPGVGKDDLAPQKFNPKEDYQVQEALTHLKAFDVFQKMLAAKGSDPYATSSTPTTQSPTKRE